MSPATSEAYVKEIDIPASQEATDSSEEIDLSIEEIIEAIEQKFGQFEDAKEENEENSAIKVQIGPQDEFSYSIYTNKFSDVLRLFTNQRSISFGKTLENFIFFILSAILVIGTVVFISYVGYTIYYSTGTSRMLLKRLGQVQSDKIKLLKIIDNFSRQNATFYKMVRNESDF